MTDRREFLGAMLAVFCGVALPAPVRELVVVPARPSGMWTNVGAPGAVLTPEILEAALKKAYSVPLTAQFIPVIILHAKDRRRLHYSANSHFWELPAHA